MNRKTLLLLLLLVLMGEVAALAWHFWSKPDASAAGTTPGPSNSAADDGGGESGMPTLVRSADGAFLRTASPLRQEPASSAELALDNPDAPQSARLEAARKHYEAIAQRVAKATETIDSEIGVTLAEYRNTLRQAVREYRDHGGPPGEVTAEERHFGMATSDREGLALLSAWFLSPDLPPVAALRAGLPEQTGEQALALAAEFDKSLQAKLKDVSIDPPRFATDKNRYSLPCPDLKPDIDWKTAGTWEPEKNRLPESWAGWTGRLKADPATGQQKPFDFQREVWNFQSLRPVGGGIHLGATGHYAGPPLGQFVLRYDLKRQELVLTGPAIERDTAPSVFRMAHIKPELLKPLYQFVAAGRNAAISIGHGMEPTENQFSLNLTVLLDPFLVDTPIGQDLILADSIPWTFHGNGAESKAFSESVAKLTRQTYEETYWLVSNALEDWGPSQREAVVDWARTNSGELGGDVLGELVIGMLASADVREPQEASVARGAIGSAQQWIGTGHAPKDKEMLRESLIVNLVCQHAARAVLMDEPRETKIELANERITVRGKMRFSYARMRVTTKGDRMYLGKAPGDDREVEPLDKLNELVNAHYSEIERGCASLKRVARYAELAALLRWAVEASGNGQLGGIDFSELVGTAARDRRKFPTPDVLTQSL